jgi:hypothetical protein
VTTDGMTTMEIEIEASRSFPKQTQDGFWFRSLVSRCCIRGDGLIAPTHNLRRNGPLSI